MFSIECFGLWVLSLVFSLNVLVDSVVMGSGLLWYQTIVKERKKRQEMLLRVMRALSVALGRIMQRV